MKHTPITPLAATFAASIAAIGLLFLAACSATSTPVVVSDPATPTLMPEIISPTVPSPTQPAPAQPIPATAPVANSPLPSPIPGADEPASAVIVGLGGPAPDFTLQGAQGVSVTLSDYQSGTSVGSVEPSNVLLVFYQGKT